MATLDRLVTETQKAFKRPVRLWLTELGYQSNPPDRLLGVSPALQASYIAAAAYKAWATPRVDLLIQYLYRDEPGLDRWQSGLETTAGRSRPAMGAVEAPLAQVSRKGTRTTIWGDVRDGSGARTYRLQRLDTVRLARGRRGSAHALQRNLPARASRRARRQAAPARGRDDRATTSSSASAEMVDSELVHSRLRA